jgi:hypothetical protein
MIVSRELSKYKLDSVEVQEVRWEGGGTEPAGEYTFFDGKVNEKLNEVRGKEEFRVEVSNRFSALEDLGAEVEIDSAWETIRENIKISAKESLG